jgi:hypothetical protein
MVEVRSRRTGKAVDERERQLDGFLRTGAIDEQCRRIVVHRGGALGFKFVEARRRRQQQRGITGFKRRREDRAPVLGVPLQFAFQPVEDQAGFGRMTGGQQTARDGQPQAAVVKGLPRGLVESALGQRLPVQCQLRPPLKIIAVARQGVPHPFLLPDLQGQDPQILPPLCRDQEVGVRHPDRGRIAELPRVALQQQQGLIRQPQPEIRLSQAGRLGRRHRRTRVGPGQRDRLLFSAHSRQQLPVKRVFRQRACLPPVQPVQRRAERIDIPAMRRHHQLKPARDSASGGVFQGRLQNLASLLGPLHGTPSGQVRRMIELKLRRLGLAGTELVPAFSELFDLSRMKPRLEQQSLLTFRQALLHRCQQAQDGVIEAEFVMDLRGQLNIGPVGASELQEPTGLPDSRSHVAGLEPVQVKDVAQGAANQLRVSRVVYDRSVPGRSGLLIIAGGC